MVTVHKGLIPQSTVQQLVEYFRVEDRYLDPRPDVVTKSPVWDGGDWPQEILANILDQVHEKPWHVEYTEFCRTVTHQWGVHTDTGYGLDKQPAYQVTLIPLTTSGPCGTVFFDNYWSGQCAKFTKEPFNRFKYKLVNRHGDTEYVEDIRVLKQQLESGQETNFDADILDTLEDLVVTRDQQHGYQPRNIYISDYSVVKNSNNQPFSEDLRQKYCRHIPAEDLHGLVFEEYVEWNPGDVITFPRNQLHCASSGVLDKLGITILSDYA
jgi:hypothetical protein